MHNSHSNVASRPGRICFMVESSDPQARLLHIGEFPSKLHDEVANRLALGSVGMSTIRVIDGIEQARPCGSGSLITLRGRRGILTADHVAEKLEDADRVNLLVDWQGGLRRCAYEREELMIARLARGTDDGDGPDLAIVFLPEQAEATKTLIDNKVFYDLDRRITQFNGNYYAVEWGFWFPCGVPAEGGEDLGPMRGFSNVHGLWGLCAISGRPHEFKHAEYDYLDIRVPESGQSIPTDLGGMSGAGLWQVKFRQNTNGEIRVEEYILSGVAFYEWYAPNRRLRCHGRQSIHERLPLLVDAYLDKCR